MSTLLQAHNEWNTRPADQRFETLEALQTYVQTMRDNAATSQIRMSRLTAEPAAHGLELVGEHGQRASMTNWSFGQLANRIGAPAEYLRGLPLELAAENVNHGLRYNDNKALMLLDRIGGDGAALQCRAFTSDEYSRIWSAELVARLIPLQANGWQIPPARPSGMKAPGARQATAADCLANSQRNSAIAIKPGDWIAPAGLYASDRDLFAFMVNEENRIEDGSPGGLSRGFFAVNSEVGASSLRFTSFLYRAICGNHIVWGAKNVRELRIVHRGGADRQFGYKLQVELRKYADEAASADEARIETCKRCVLGAKRDDVLDLLFAKKILPLKSLERAYEYAIDEADRHAAGSPKTAWGMAQGLTRLSQDSEYADRRNEIDRAAGKILDLAF